MTTKVTQGVQKMTPEQAAVLLDALLRFAVARDLAETSRLQSVQQGEAAPASVKVHEVRSC